MVPDCVRAALRPLIGQVDALDEAIGAIDSALAAFEIEADKAARRLIAPLQVVGQRRDRRSAIEGHEFLALSVFAQQGREFVRSA